MTQAQDEANAVLRSASASDLSVADIAFIENWPARRDAEETSRVNGWMKDRRTANADKRSELSDRIYEATQEANSIYEDARRGSRPYPELMKDRRLVQQRIAGLEQLVEAVESSESLVAAISGDPISYMDSMHQKYPGLADRRSRLDVALAEDRRRRRQR